MANIKVTVDYTIVNGQPLTFKSPADCSQVTGLVVSYPEGGTNKTKTFQFADAHGNNVGSIDLFASNVLVKVILDVEASKAYVQNADTNAYLESKFDSKLDKAGGTIASSKFAPFTLKRTTADGGNAVCFENSSGVLGYLGIRSNKVPTFYEEDTSLMHTIMHSGNKPSGTYTGNGSAAERKIDIGGISDLLYIKNYSSGRSAIIGFYGGFEWNDSTSTVTVIPEYAANFAAGVLTMKTANDTINKTSASIGYRVI